MIHILAGGTVMACAVAVLFFLRFWLRTRDPLFGGFAIAFALMGINWLLLAATDPAYEFRPFLYVIRLVAFLVILGAVVQKNRPRST